MLEPQRLPVLRKTSRRRGDGAGALLLVAGGLVLGSIGLMVASCESREQRFEKELWKGVQAVERKRGL